MTNRLDVERPDDPSLLRLLLTHPKVRVVESGAPQRGLVFSQGDWARRVVVGAAPSDLAGLPELVDNNPMVCADRFAVPSPGATLALIALGPLARAGILIDQPVLMANVPLDVVELERLLGELGWSQGVVVDEATIPWSGAVALTAIAHLTDSGSELDDLYEEAFGRSVYVRRDQTSEWGSGLVAGTPHALYRIAWPQERQGGLATIHVLADREGKCGSAQIVHAMNIMAGFEESLGIG